MLPDNKSCKKYDIIFFLLIERCFSSTKNALQYVQSISIKIICDLNVPNAGLGNRLGVLHVAS